MRAVMLCQHDGWRRYGGDGATHADVALDKVN